VLNKPVADVIQIPTMMNESQPFRPQLCVLINAAKVSILVLVDVPLEVCEWAGAT